MTMLWKLIRRLTGRMPAKVKRSCFLLLNCAVSGLAGLMIWLIVRWFALNSPEWMVCFVGYPAIFYGLFGGLLFMMNIDDRSEE